MKKLFGYLLAGLGLIGLLVSLEGVKKNIGFLGGVNSGSLLIVSLVLIGVGVVIIYLGGKGGKVHEEHKDDVPIFKGDKIVGYRRH
jgi:hypothetical protein